MTRFLPLHWYCSLFICKFSQSNRCESVWKTMERVKFLKKSSKEEKLKRREEKNRVADFGCWLPFKLLQHLVKMYFYNVSCMRNIQSGGTSAPCYVSIRTLKRLCKELRMFWANHLGRNCLLWRRSWRSRGGCWRQGYCWSVQTKRGSMFHKTNVYMARCALYPLHYLLLLSSLF